MVDIPSPALKGAKALVVGVANEHSIAYGCAKAFHEIGADIAITYLNEKAKPHVEPLAKELEAPIFMPLDVSQDGMLETVFDEIRQRWGRLDILVHSIAFAPAEDLKGGLLDCSGKGFSKAMDISCHSFIRMAKLAAPLMTDGGSNQEEAFYLGIPCILMRRVTERHEGLGSNVVISNLSSDVFQTFMGSVDGYRIPPMNHDRQSPAPHHSGRCHSQMPPQ